MNKDPEHTTDDDYGIKPIVKQYTVESNALTKEINEHLDKTLTPYLMDMEDIRRGAFTEIRCYLLKALIDTRGNNDQLRARINDIAKCLEDVYKK